MPKSASHCDTTLGTAANFSFTIGINAQSPHPTNGHHTHNAMVSPSSATSPQFRNGGPLVQSIPAVIKSYKSNQNVQLYKATSMATTGGGIHDFVPTTPNNSSNGCGPSTPYLTSSAAHSCKNGPSNICQSPVASVKMDTLPSLIHHQIVPLPPRPPPPLVIPEGNQNCRGGAGPSNMNLPTLIAYHNNVSSSNNTTNESGQLRRPPESEKNSPKSENSDDSGCYQTDSSLEESERRCKRMRNNEMGRCRPTVHNQSSDSGLSTSRQSEDSSSGEDSPSFMDDLECKASSDHNKSLVNVYLHRVSTFTGQPRLNEVVKP